MILMIWKLNQAAIAASHIDDQLEFGGAELLTTETVGRVHGGSTAIGQLDFQPAQHEIEQGFETLEAEVARQRTKIIKKGLAAGQGGAQHLVFLVNQLLHGVQQEGQQVEGGQQGRQMLLAVAEIVRQMVALGFERVIVFVLDFPARSASFNDLGDIALIDRLPGDESIVVNRLADSIGGDQFAPVDCERIFTLAQGQLRRKAIGVGKYLFAMAAGDPVGVHPTAALYALEPLVQRDVGTGFAHEDEVQAGTQDLFAQRLMAVQIIAQLR